MLLVYIVASPEINGGYFCKPNVVIEKYDKRWWKTLPDFVSRMFTHVLLGKGLVVA